MSSYVVGHVKKKIKPKFHVFGWFLGLQKLHVFLENSLHSNFFEIIFGQKQFPKAYFFRLCDSLPFNLEESRELRALIRWALA